jgi:hypothetical protein
MLTLSHLSDTQRSLLVLSLEIARDRFIENAASGVLPALSDQFSAQAKEAQELITIFNEADVINIASSGASRA